MKVRREAVNHLLFKIRTKEQKVLASVLCFSRSRDNWAISGLGAVCFCAFIIYRDVRFRFAGRLLIIVMPMIIRNYSRDHYHNSIIGLLSVSMKLLTIGWCDYASRVWQARCSFSA